MTNLAGTARAAFVLVALGVATAVFVDIARDAERDRLDGLVAFLSSLGAAVLSSWLALAIMITALASVPGVIGQAAGVLGMRITPAAARRVVQVMLGVSLATAVTSLPLAASAQAPPSTVILATATDEMFAALPQVSRPEQSPDSTGGWTPVVPAPMSATTPHSPVAVVSTPPRDAEAVPDEVVVRRGDSLWAIAARALGPAASDAEVAAAWPRWFDANRAAIGPDPDVIRPGTVLHAPA